MHTAGFTRRDFMKTGGAAGLAVASCSWRAAAQSPRADRPNVLWISAEDISPDLGCYGDSYAVSPHLDRFAGQAIRFERAFGHMGVCAPVRSGIITGMYPTSIGTNPMRCQGVPPPQVHCFTEALRRAGYYCTNRSKTDYQFASPDSAWDDCSGDAHWQGRRAGQPFFSVINLGTTHEGQIRSSRRRAQIEDQLEASERHDPAAAPLPPYHPDTPVVRRDWAQYYDLITLMDRQVGQILDDVERDGLADSTIVWFWGDHGRGLPRCKRWIYDSGLRFPLLIRVPEPWRDRLGISDAPGSVNDELAGFLDFAPTMFSLCGVPIPDHLPGRAILGPRKGPEPPVIFAARDRVDEASDTIRALRDRRFKYIRNLRPELPRSLPIQYMDRMPTMQEMRRLHAEGRLQGSQRQFFECPKPVEELYDCERDPHEVHNLADDPACAERLGRMRQALFSWMAASGDTGLLPEPELDRVKRPGERMLTTSAPGVRRVGVNPGEDNVRVALSCATAGASLLCRVDRREASDKPGGIRLDYATCRVHGDGLRKTPDRGIIAWRDVDTWISWEVPFPQAGTYPVHVLSACNGRGGSPYELTVGDRRLRATVQNTGGWDNHRYSRVGEVNVPAPGTYTVSLKPLPQERAYSMNLKAVVLGAEQPESWVELPTWQLYSAPLLLRPGHVLEVKACRLGYKDSPVVRWQPGQAPPKAQPAPLDPGWWTQHTPKEAAAIVALLQRGGGNAVPLERCRETLDSPDAPVRYWAVRGLAFHLGALSNDAATTDGHLVALRALLSDSCASVRIAAAQVVYEHSTDQAALDVLLRELRQDQPAMTRLMAASAFRDLGDKARPALDAIRAAGRDENGYVKRLCSTIVSRFENA